MSDERDRVITARDELERKQAYYARQEWTPTITLVVNLLLALTALVLLRGRGE